MKRIARMIKAGIPFSFDGRRIKVRAAIITRQTLAYEDAFRRYVLNAFSNGENVWIIPHSDYSGATVDVFTGRNLSSPDDVVNAIIAKPSLMEEYMDWDAHNNNWYTSPFQFSTNKLEMVTPENLEDTINYLVSKGFLR